MLTTWKGGAYFLLRGGTLLWGMGRARGKKEEMSFKKAGSLRATISKNGHQRSTAKDSPIGRA